MKILKAMAVMAVVVVLAGCASVQTASKADLNGRKLTMDNKAQDVAHINGNNWGFYFLKWGLISGSTENLGDMTFMKDTVRVDKVVDIVTNKSKSLGAKETVDLQSTCTSIMLPFPIPFLFFIKEVQVSGNAVK